MLSATAIAERGFFEQPPAGPRARSRRSVDRSAAHPRRTAARGVGSSRRACPPKSGWRWSSRAPARVCGRNCSSACSRGWFDEPDGGCGRSARLRTAMGRRSVAGRCGSPGGRRVGRAGDRGAADRCPGWGGEAAQLAALAQTIALLEGGELATTSKRCCAPGAAAMARLWRDCSRWRRRGGAGATARAASGAAQPRNGRAACTAHGQTRAGLRGGRCGTSGWAGGARSTARKAGVPGSSGCVGRRDPPSSLLPAAPAVIDSAENITVRFTRRKIHVRLFRRPAKGDFSSCSTRMPSRP